MMLEHIGELNSARIIEQAIVKVITQDLESMSAGEMGHTTSEVGDLVVKYVKEA